MIRLFAAAAVFGALSACTAAGSFTPTETSDRDDQILQKALLTNLKDPSSAQIRNVQTFANPRGGRMTCGMINAKNAFGGYTGFQQFTVVSAQSVDYSRPYIQPAFSMGPVASIDCGGAGYVASLS